MPPESINPPKAVPVLSELLQARLGRNYKEYNFLH